MAQALIQLGIGFVIGLSGVLIPGPMLAFVILKASSDGFKAGPLAVAGHVLVELAIISLIGMGLISLLESQTFQVAIGVTGGVLLLALGVLYLSRINQPSQIQPNLIGLKHHPLIGGILFSTILNPSVPIWWATIGLVTFMNAFLAAGIAGAILWLVGHFLADLIWYSLVAYSTSRGRYFIGAKPYKGLLIICGCLLVVFGGYFIFQFGLPLVQTLLHF